MRAFVLSSAAILVLAGTSFAQLANDTCSSPQALTGFGQTAFDTNGSVTEGPNPSCAPCNNDVWYSWTATETGRVQVDTCTNASFDTVVAIYAGTDCSAGEVVCNDDSCGTRSKVVFDAVAGQQYLFRVGCYYANTVGTGTLSVSVAPPEGVLGGPFVYEGNGHTYYLLESSSWTDAEARAVELGGHLATIRNEEENLFVYNSVMRFDGNGIRRGWIGLTDVGRAEGDYVWTSGEPVTYTNWAAGEPNHSNGEEFYAQIPWYATTWNDNRDLPGDDACYGIVEIGSTTPACTADLGVAGGLPGQDGMLDNNDFIAFITYFFNVDTHADLGVAGGLPGSDGMFDNNDFIAFINFFFDGCGA